MPTLTPTGATPGGTRRTHLLFRDGKNSLFTTLYGHHGTRRTCNSKLVAGAGVSGSSPLVGSLFREVLQAAGALLELRSTQVNRYPVRALCWLGLSKVRQGYIITSAIRDAGVIIAASTNPPKRPDGRLKHWLLEHRIEDAPGPEAKEGRSEQHPW